MIEAAMYFALGLLTAGMVALMIAPAVWRRAVRLTQSRIESSVPLTLSEIQADKDQLRAEFAMSTRRLEMSIERLKERAADQLLELNRKREQINKLTELRSGKVDDLRELEEREAALRARLSEKEQSYSRASAELDSLEAKVSERSQALARLEVSLEETRTLADEQKVELVARDTEIDNLRDSLAAAKAGASAATVERAAIEASLTELKANLAREERRAEDLRHRVDAQEQDLAIRTDELKQRHEELEQLRAELTAEARSKEDAEARLAEAEAARIAAEAEITDLSLRIEAGPAGAIGDNVQKALASVQSEKDVLAGRIIELEQEREKLSAENAELRRVAGEEWETERMETALLRERLNDIAAEVVRLTHSMDGTAQHAAELVATEGADQPDGDESKPAVTNGSGSNSEADAAEEGEGNRKSLAERIRALQHSAAGNS